MKSQGPLSYQNWNVFNTQPRCKCIYEYIIASDAIFLQNEDIIFGPYKFVTSQTEVGKTNIHLSIESHLTINLPSEFPNKSEIDNYHGGSIADEITAIASLILGVRLKPYLFRIIAKECCASPVFETTAYGDNTRQINIDPIFGNTKIPQATGEHELQYLSKLNKFMALKPEQALILVKSARQFQDAILLSESNPELSWLLFISSIETVANEWGKNIKDNIESVKLVFPKLIGLLQKNNDLDLTNEACGIIAPLIGSTRKFKEFILNFKPNPLYVNIPDESKISWNGKEFEEIITIIYNLRSKALHGGIQFPSPMCRPPRKIKSEYEEKPFKSDFQFTAFPTGVWKTKDIPIHLNTFVYIGKNAILNWWDSICK